MVLRWYLDGDTIKWWNKDGNPLMLRLRLRDSEGEKIVNTQMERHK